MPAWMRTFGVLLGAGALLSAACARKQDSPGKPCPRDTSAFRVQVVGPDDSLPQGLELTVSFGGASKEAYLLGADDQDNKTLCCQAGPAVRGALPPVSCASSNRMALKTDAATSSTPDARVPRDLWITDGGVKEDPAHGEGTNSSQQDSVAPSAIQCELWTGGAAEIEVHAAGYAPIEETLTAVLREDEPFEDCPALKTLDVRLVLSRGDGGLP